MPDIVPAPAPANTYTSASISVSAEILAEVDIPISDEEIGHHKKAIGDIVETIDNISANNAGRDTSTFTKVQLDEQMQNNLLHIQSANTNPTWYTSNSAIASAVAKAKAFIS